MGTWIFFRGHFFFRTFMLSLKCFTVGMTVGIAICRPFIFMKLPIESGCFGRFILGNLLRRFFAVTSQFRPARLGELTASEATRDEIWSNAHGWIPS